MRTNLYWTTSDHYNFMANSRYEYVKSFEANYKVLPAALFVVRVDGRNFRKFSEVHHFEKPYDLKALNLMNLCAATVMEEYQDIAFAYGFSDEFSFIFKKDSSFYQRRISKILSLVVAFFTSLYATKWKQFFPEEELRHAPSFQAHVIQCPTLDVLQTYLAWRQNECHVNNQYDTCFWKLIESGKSEMDARDTLKDSKKQERNELLFHLGVNYKNLLQIFRQGTCLIKTEVEDIVKYTTNGDPVKRMRRKIKEFHSDHIVSVKFWNEHPCLLRDIGGFNTNACKINPEYTEYFQSEEKLLQSTWVVIRIDGCHFHRFSDVHEFEKPNDEHALNLMNSCAVAVLQEFKDIVFAYGVSDEYSFVLRKESQLYGRHDSKIVSVIVSLFNSTYIIKWKEYFPHKEMMYPASFDGRVVCYPTYEILRDYLSWRQVDCHINNQYNTCFWMLVKSGKSKSEAQKYLKGTQTQEKNELLKVKFGIDYNTLPIMFRKGSCVFVKKESKKSIGGTCEKWTDEVIIDHSDIIGDSFWIANPHILDEMAHVT